MARSIFKILRSIILISVVGSAIHYLVNAKSFTFKATDVKRVGEKYVGQHPSQCLPKIINDLRRLHGLHLLNAANTRWINFSGGGMRGKMYLLHLSWTEYLTVVGFPLAAAGHSGIHWMNQSCSILTGNLQRAKDDAASLQREDFGPGDHVRFGMFEGSHLSAGEDTWMLCYGRGVVLASVPYVTLDSLISNADPISVAHLYYVGVKSLAAETAHAVQEFFYHHKKRFFP